MSSSRPSQIDDRANAPVKCSCKGFNLDKMLQPKILAILAREHLHGYVLIQKLEDTYTHCSDRFDTAGFYRTLLSLEQRNLIQAEWDVPSSGPHKKVYQITAEGRDCLSNWLATLKDYQITIQALIDETRTSLDR